MTGISRHQPETGKTIKRKGVYIGTWEPMDKKGRALGKIFDLYSSPEDIRNGGDNILMTFNDAVNYVAGLKDYYGHDGSNFSDEKAVLEAVRKNPEALAEWFIPTKEILHGHTISENKVQLGNLFDSRNMGDFRRTFITNLSSGSISDYYQDQRTSTGISDHYWSLTEDTRYMTPHAYRVAFAPREINSVEINNVSSGNKTYGRISTRLVRAELIFART